MDEKEFRFVIKDKETNLFCNVEFNLNKVKSITCGYNYFEHSFVTKFKHRQVIENVLDQLKEKFGDHYCFEKYDNKTGKLFKEKQNKNWCKLFQKITEKPKEPKIKFIFKWYDFWIGIFVDKSKKSIYIFYLPMCGIKIKMK